MPAPRPPKLTRPTPNELKRASQQIARSQRLTVSPPLTMAQSSSGFQLGVDTSKEFFLARLTGVYTVTGGPQIGLNLYSFVEQLFDPATGLPIDAPAGRKTYSISGIPTSAYALEVSNAYLAIPDRMPAGYTNSGPYVVMRLKGVVNGVPVYEFIYALEPEIALLQSDAPNGAGYYDAILQYWYIDPISGAASWQAGPSIWLKDANN